MQNVPDLMELGEHGTILASGKEVLGTSNSCNHEVVFHHLVAAFQG